MMNNNKLIQFSSIGVIIISVAISGYIILGFGKTITSQNGVATIIDGKQVIAMTVYSANYQPNSFTVKVGVPVRWEITSSGQPSCDSGVVVSSLLPSGSVYLNPSAGQVTVAEFTPQVVGKYIFACPMAMVRGVIEVVN